MNTCKYCGFVGEAKYFRSPTGKVCKECRKKQQQEQGKKYYQDNRENLLSKNKEWRKENCEQIAEHNKEYYKINKEEINGKNKKYYEDNCERINKQTKEYRRNNRELIVERKKKYREDNKEKIAEHSKEQYEKNRERNGILHWSQIKHLCLGLYVEKAIAGMFGVPTEQHGNPKVDFICPNGYKIQVKTSSIRYNRGASSWIFHIDRNKIADYFILVAVNNIDDINKEDFEPAHIWMIKGKVINKQAGASVTPSRVSKWDEYSIMEEYENKFINCCNTIKKR